MEIRDLEKTGYFGYLFFIRYDGTKFDSFDENNISYYKGIQQAGRTDKDVSAEENILYINTKQELKLENFRNSSVILEIFDIKKTLPYLELPKLIEKRHYIYRYPKDRIKSSIEEIDKKCRELSGKHDVSAFTTKKGRELKEKIRELVVYYENQELHFTGSSFMPQQVLTTTSASTSNSFCLIPTHVGVSVSFKVTLVPFKISRLAAVSRT